MQSFVRYGSLLPELCDLVSQASNPLATARLAMTCAAEDQRRRQWYWSHMSGERTVFSYLLAIVRHGSDGDARHLMDRQPALGERYRLVDHALRCQRDDVVLHWMTSAWDAGHTWTHAASPFRFNSRASSMTAIALMRPSFYWTRDDVEEYWDVKEGLKEDPRRPMPWFIDLALEREDRAFFLKYPPGEPPMPYSLRSPERTISIDFFEFLFDRGVGITDRWVWRKSIPHLKAVMHRSGLPAYWNIEWTPDALERDTWLAKERGWDMAEQWRLHQAYVEYHRQSARDWITIMEYHRLRWTRVTLMRAIDDGDYAAVLWHLKQPERCASALLQVDMRALGTRLLEDLLANGWLEQDPLGQIAFSPRLPKSFALSLRPPCPEQ